MIDMWKSISGGGGKGADFYRICCDVCEICAKRLTHNYVTCCFLCISKLVLFSVHFEISSKICIDVYIYDVYEFWFFCYSCNRYLLMCILIYRCERFQLCAVLIVLLVYFLHAREMWWYCNEMIFSIVQLLHVVHANPLSWSCTDLQ